jgi:hypothetical protein
LFGAQQFSNVARHLILLGYNLILLGNELIHALPHSRKIVFSHLILSLADLFDNLPQLCKAGRIRLFLLSSKVLNTAPQAVNVVG